MISQKLTIIGLDGTKNKSSLGANAMLAVSLACTKVGAKEERMHIFQYVNKNNILSTIPMMNILNGGSHADNSIDFQEFMIMPVRPNTFSDALRMGTEVFII